MATLAEILRSYQPTTNSALTEPIVNHFKSLPEKAAKNIEHINWMVQNSNPYDYTGGKNPYYSYDPQAAKEFNEYVPNLMGATNSVAPRKEILSNAFDKIFGFFNKNEKIPNLPEGVVYEKLHPTVQTRLKEGMIDPYDAQWMSDYAYTPGNSRVETGTGAYESQSEKMQNFLQRIKNKEVSNPWPGDEF